MSYVDRYERGAGSPSREEKLSELIKIVRNDPKKLESAFKYAISAKLSEHEQMGLLLEIVREKEETLDATLGYLRKA